jgi:hypothetical protein
MSRKCSRIEMAATATIRMVSVSTVSPAPPRVKLVCPPLARVTFNCCQNTLHRSDQRRSPSQTTPLSLLDHMEETEFDPVAR